MSKNSQAHIRCLTFLRVSNSLLPFSEWRSFKTRSSESWRPLDAVQTPIQMSKIRLILWVHTFFQYSVVHAQNSENNDDINFEPVQARIPQNLLKSYEITVNFRARTNVRNVRISDFESWAFGFQSIFYILSLEFFASYYSSVYSTIGIVPALTKVVSSFPKGVINDLHELKEGPDGGNSSFSASIDETTPVTVFFSVPGKRAAFVFLLEGIKRNSARSASIANLAKLRDLTAMEREFTRNSLVSEFILPSVLGNQPLEPQIVGDSVCPSIDCPRYQTCTEPEGQLIAIAYCESICVADYCKNDAICTHESINVAPRCFCAEKGWEILFQLVNQSCIMISNQVSY